MGKITSEDVKPILEKFKTLTSNKPKITSSDVSGPTKTKVPEDKVAPESEEREHPATEGKDTSTPKHSKRRSVAVGMKIAQAFREEVLSGGSVSGGSSINPHKNEEVEEKEAVEDYSTFRIPKNTHVIAIDDSKLQRKLLGKLLEFAGIPPDHRTVVGDGRDEIMGFSDYCVNFVEHHTGFIFMIGKRAQANVPLFSCSIPHEEYRPLLAQLTKTWMSWTNITNTSRSRDPSAWRTFATGYPRKWNEGCLP
jgi:hypothetical protein